MANSDRNRKSFIFALLFLTFALPFSGNTQAEPWLCQQKQVDGGGEYLGLYSDDGSLTPEDLEGLNYQPGSEIPERQIKKDGLFCKIFNQHKAKIHDSIDLVCKLASIGSSAACAKLGAPPLLNSAVAVCVESGSRKIIRMSVSYFEEVCG